jgi:3-oxoacyl-[acyl-carrier-protein] synthase-3
LLPINYPLQTLKLYKDRLMKAIITGVGGSLPTTLVSNADFSSLGIDEKWIVSRSGVKERYHLGPDESLADIAQQACRLALQDSGVRAVDIDMVIVATSTADRISPGLASELAHELGTNNAAAIDLNGACAGFLYALDYAICRIDQGNAERILVVGADAMSRLTNRDDVNTAFLFGDGAGAVVVESSRSRTCKKCTQYLSFGSAGEGLGYLMVRKSTGYVEMDGGEVYIAAVDAMTEELQNVLTACELEHEDIDHIICHQANERIVRAVARRLKCSNKKALIYVDKFGNTSAASIPISLWTAQSEGVIKSKQRLALAAFGAGFTWGAGVINWKGCKHV